TTTELLSSSPRPQSADTGRCQKVRLNRKNLKYYTPSIAPSGLLVYSGRSFLKWQGNFFSGALKLKHLNRVDINSENKPINEQRLLTKLEERMRCVIQDSHEGWIYLSTDSGKILRLKPVVKQEK
ncbi:MAG: PQQ-dependent sugar dehydrogenase, partial [Gammaproteobacteria bacterium]|nr:PQQ-dependent sugar dehydrogenase [Gammaproteobacteria bacterium]